MSSSSSAALNALNTQIRTTLRDGFAALEQDLTTPLFDAFTEAARAHRTLQENLNRAAPSTDPSTPTEPEVSGRVYWGAVRAYRQGLHTDVIAPLADRLETLHIGHILAAERRALLDALAVLADGLLYETPTLYHQAAYHLNVRLPDALVPLFKQVLQAHAQPVARLEIRTTVHLHAVWELERLLDQPAYHVPLSPLAPALPPTEAQIQDAVRETTEAEAALQAGLDLAASFDRHLHTLAERTDPAETYAALAEAKAGAAAEALAREVAQARDATGPFGRTPTARKLAPPRTLKRLDATDEPWKQWHQRAAGRLRVQATTLAFLEAIDQATATLLQDAFEAGVRPGQQALMQAEQTLRALHLDPEAKTTGGAKRQQAVQAVLRKALAAVEREPVQVLHAKGLGQAVQAAVDRFMETLAHHIERLPQAIPVNVLQKPEAEQTDPGVEIRTVRMRRFATGAFDTLLYERLQAIATPLSETRTRVLKAVQEVPSILRFNLEAAAEEWALAHHAGTAEDRAEHEAAAQELSTGGLDRSADALVAQVGQLGTALHPLARTVHAAIGRSLMHLQEQLRIESPVQERLLDLRQAVATLVHTLAGTAREQATRGGILLRYHLRLGKQQAGRLLHLGQAVIGTGPVDEEEQQETLDALAEVDALRLQLPAVYRRLFSFRPVTDPVLLVGRDDDLKRLKKHMEQWQRGSTNTLMITGHSGTGFTSFVNVAQHTLFGGADTVHAISLETRLNTEAEFAARIVEVLRLPDEAATGLDALAHHLLEQVRPEESRVCFIEHMEHLILRKVGGTHLLDRILTFLSRTDSRVLWIGLTNDASWQFIEKAEPGAASLVVRHALPPLERAEVETLILNRHQRSGMVLVFEEVDLKHKPLLRRRLHKATSYEEKQTLLRADYFDRLFRASGQNVLLSLFYWLRSVRIDEAGQTVQVHGIYPLNFAFLDTFNLAHAFTLKSFLEHTTLTIGEHSEIFQIMPAESEQIFESLGNKFLIEPIPADPTAPPSLRLTFTTIDRGVRYRLRPLVVQPIIAYLRRQNIVH